jgi:hypothetical protein
MLKMVPFTSFRMTFAPYHAFHATTLSAPPAPP